MTSLVYDLAMYYMNCKLITVTKVWMKYYVIILIELDLRYLYEINTQNEDVESNPFNLADINNNYYDINDILSDKFNNNNFQCKVFHLNI